MLDYADLFYKIKFLNQLFYNHYLPKFMINKNIRFNIFKVQKLIVDHNHILKDKDIIFWNHKIFDYIFSNVPKILESE